LKEDGLRRAVDLVQTRLLDELPEGTRSLVLILINAETSCPKAVAPSLFGWAKKARSDADIACVLPNPMFETWFAASAASLAGVNDLPEDLPVPDDPEGDCIGKSWVKSQLRIKSSRRAYKETVDQPRFAARIDLTACRQNSASFDKLCRELAARLSTDAGGGNPST
jgi:hypothetical protein